MQPHVSFPLVGIKLASGLFWVEEEEDCGDEDVDPSCRAAQLCVINRWLLLVQVANGCFIAAFIE